MEAIYQDWTIKINLFDIVSGHTAIIIIVQTSLISTASYLAGRQSSCGEMARQGMIYETNAGTETSS